MERLALAFTTGVIGGAYWVCDVKFVSQVFSLLRRVSGLAPPYLDKYRLLYKLDDSNEWRKVWLLPTGVNPHHAIGFDIT